jgi:predicted phosphodiesterase
MGRLGLLCFGLLWIVSFVAARSPIPTTLEGPFKPFTRKFDPSLRSGSDDLPMWDPRVVKRVPAIFPEQISLALSTPDAMWVSWISGDWQMGPRVTPLDPTSVKSVVEFGTASGSYTQSANGTSEVYSQIYPFEGLLNYTSGIIHHVRLTGLKPETTYYYRCGDPTLSAMSSEHTFKTLPLPGPSSYPTRVAIIGDLGMTYNSSSTVDHMIKNNPDVVLMVGDLSYANLYITNGTGTSDYGQTFGKTTPIHETYQPRWDMWQRMIEPLTSKVPFMVLEGNHEHELQIDNKSFVAYNARFAVPQDESGSGSSMYYSFNAGGIHFVMIGAYTLFKKTSEQYRWLQKDLAEVDRTVTPWVIALTHPPWYNSYRSHYREVECMRQSMEALLYNFGVDVMFHGHVHAYERVNRMYNYKYDACGPVYITVGDGGNGEKLALLHADDEGGCPDPMKTPDHNFAHLSGYCGFNFSNGKFCWDQQPVWSAWRDSSFGHGIMEVKNSTHMLWTWHRNQDHYDQVVGDQIYIVRQPEICMNQNYLKRTASTHQPSKM